MSAHCRPQLDFQLNQNGVRIIWTIFLYLKPLNYKLMLPHKSYSLTPNITSYNVLITNFLEVSGTFLEKNINSAWERLKGQNLKLLSLWPTLSVRNRGVGGGFGRKIFPPPPPASWTFNV